MVMLLVAVLIFRGQKNKKDEKVYLGYRICGLGLLALLFSLYIFPWNAICSIGDWAMKLFRTMEYSWRYYVVAIPFICAGGLLGLKVYREEESGMKPKILLAGIVIVATCMILNYNDLLLTSATPYRIYTPEAIDEYYEYHYLPIDADTEAYLSRNHPFSGKDVYIQEIERDGMNMTVEVANGNSTSILTVPYVFYEGYEAISLHDKKSLKL